MTRVAIHQPNYLPWLGFFRKIHACDAMVLLDDAQFPKHSYTNRVRILGARGPRWLTVPVSVHLGDPIRAVRPTRGDWARRHLDTLRGCYARAPAFREGWPEVSRLLGAAPDADLAEINALLIEEGAVRLGLGARFVRASELGLDGVRGAERLARLVRAIDPGGVYLSGSGGAKYQEEADFAAHGIPLVYLDFRHPEYPQGAGPFVPGLSFVDAVFHVGWERTAALVAGG